MEKGSGKIKDKIASRVIPQSRVLVDRGSLPSETLRSGSLETGQSRDVAQETVLRASTPWLIDANVPLQVFSGETTPILRMGSPIITVGFPSRWREEKGGALN
jgi:hypothetical protein